MNTDSEQGQQAEARLERGLRELPREVEPGRDLWPAIEARLSRADADRAVTPTSWWPKAALAAAVAAAAVLPFLLRERPVSEDVPAIASVPPETDLARPELRLRNAAATAFSPGPEYESARDELLGLLEQRLASLAPEEREIVVRNIEAIRSALEEIDTALQDNPDDPLLQELLLKTYQTELDVMARVNGLAGPARRRTDL